MVRKQGWQGSGEEAELKGQFATEKTKDTGKQWLFLEFAVVFGVLRGESYLRLAGGMMLFMRRYTTICP